MTATVTLPDGSTAEVESSAIALPEGAQLLAPGATPEGFVAKDFMAAEIRRRTKDTDGLRAELLADPETTRAVFEAAGLALGDDGKPAIPDVSSAVQKALAKFEEEKLKPVQEADKALREKLARQALLAASKGLVRDEFATPIAGGPAYVETILGARTRYDAELGYVVGLGEDGEPLPSANPAPGRPYADAAELVSSFLATDAGALLRVPDPERQRGAGYSGAGGSGSPPKRSAMSVKEKAAYVSEHGQEAYQKLPQ